MHTATHLLHLYGYPLITGMITLECCGLLLPGETLMLAGALLAAHGHLNIYFVVGAAIAGALVGNVCGYWLGTVLGHRLVAHYGARVGLTAPRLAVGRYLFARHGGKMVFFARFGTVVRSLSAVLAGANDMPRRTFLWWTLAGGVAWPCIYGFGAYFLGNAFKRLSGPISIGCGIAAVTAIGAALWYAHRNRHRLTEAALLWEAQNQPNPAHGSMPPSPA